MRTISISSLLFLLTSIPAAADETLFFTTRNQYGPEQTLSGSGGTILGRLTKQDIEVVTPREGGGYSAEKFATSVGWSTLAGDFNGDGVYYEHDLFHAIDAMLTISPDGPPSLRDVFVSPARAAGSGCLGTLEPGDVAAIGRSGVLEYFVTEQLIRRAFDIPQNRDANVDAVCLDRFGNLLISVEKNTVILGGVAVGDGAVLCVPAADITHSGRTITSIVPGSGFVLYTERQMDDMVVNARVANSALGVVQEIVDTDGLCQDPRGGKRDIHLEDGRDVTVAELLFSGQRLQGGGVLSTLNNGSIAEINGVPLGVWNGTHWDTEGPRVGLEASDRLVGSLNALDIERPVCRFVLDTDDPLVAAGEAVRVIAGGLAPYSVFVLYARPGPGAPCQVAASTPLSNACFPDWYSGGILYSGSADAEGYVRFVRPYGGGMAGQVQVMQAVGISPAGRGLSAPLSIQF